MMCFNKEKGKEWYLEVGLGDLAPLEDLAQWRSGLDLLRRHTLLRPGERVRDQGQPRALELLRPLGEELVVFLVG